MASPIDILRQELEPEVAAYLTDTLPESKCDYFIAMLGTRTFPEESLYDETPLKLADLGRIEESLLTEEEIESGEILKVRYLLLKECCSCSVRFGFRLSGCHLASATPPTWREETWPVAILKKSHAVDFFATGFLKYAVRDANPGVDGMDVADEIGRALNQFRQVLCCSQALTELEILGSELVVQVFPTGEVAVAWLIDSDRAVVNKHPLKNLNHRTLWCDGNSEEGLLTGVYAISQGWDSVKAAYQKKVYAAPGQEPRQVEVREEEICYGQDYIAEVEAGDNVMDEKLRHYETDVYFSKADAEDIEEAPHEQAELKLDGVLNLDPATQLTVENVTTPKATVPAPNVPPNSVATYMGLDIGLVGSSDTDGSNSEWSFTGSNFGEFFAQKNPKPNESMRGYLLRRNMEQLLLSSNSDKGSNLSGSIMSCSPIENHLQDTFKDERALLKSSPPAKMSPNAMLGTPDDLARTIRASNMDDIVLDGPSEIPSSPPNIDFRMPDSSPEAAGIAADQSAAGSEPAANQISPNRIAAKNLAEKVGVALTQLAAEGKITPSPPDDDDNTNDVGNVNYKSDELNYRLNKGTDSANAEGAAVAGNPAEVQFAVTGNAVVAEAPTLGVLKSTVGKLQRKVPAPILIKAVNPSGEKRVPPPVRLSISNNNWTKHLRLSQVMLPDLAGENIAKIRESFPSKSRVSDVGCDESLASAMQKFKLENEAKFVAAQKTLAATAVSKDGADRLQSTIEDLQAVPEGGAVDHLPGTVDKLSATIDDSPSNTRVHVNLQKVGGGGFAQIKENIGRIRRASVCGNAGTLILSRRTDRLQPLKNMGSTDNHDSGGLSMGFSSTLNLKSTFKPSPIREECSNPGSSPAGRPTGECELNKNVDCGDLSGWQLVDFSQVPDKEFILTPIQQTVPASKDMPSVEVPDESSRVSEKKASPTVIQKFARKPDPVSSTFLGASRLDPLGASKLDTLSSTFKPVQFKAVANPGLNPTKLSNLNLQTFANTQLLQQRLAGGGIGGRHTSTINTKDFKGFLGLDLKNVGSKVPSKMISAAITSTTASKISASTIEIEGNGMNSTLNVTNAPELLNIMHAPMRIPCLDTRSIVPLTQYEKEKRKSMQEDDVFSKKSRKEFIEELMKSPAKNNRDTGKDLANVAGKEDLIEELMKSPILSKEEPIYTASQELSECGIAKENAMVSAVGAESDVEKKRDDVAKEKDVKHLSDENTSAEEGALVPESGTESDQSKVQDAKNVQDAAKPRPPTSSAMVSQLTTRPLSKTNLPNALPVNTGMNLPVFNSTARSPLNKNFTSFGLPPRAPSGLTPSGLNVTAPSNVSAGSNRGFVPTVPRAIGMRIKSDVEGAAPGAQEDGSSSKVSVGSVGSSVPPIGAIGATPGVGATPTGVISSGSKPLLGSNLPSNPSSKVTPGNFRGNAFLSPGLRFVSPMVGNLQQRPISSFAYGGKFVGGNSKPVVVTARAVAGSKTEVDSTNASVKVDSKNAPVVESSSKLTYTGMGGTVRDLGKLISSESLSSDKKGLSPVVAQQGVSAAVVQPREPIETPVEETGQGRETVNFEDGTPTEKAALDSTEKIVDSSGKIMDSAGKIVSPFDGNDGNSATQKLVLPVGLSGAISPQRFTGNISPQRVTGPCAQLTSPTNAIGGGLRSPTLLNMKARPQSPLLNMANIPGGLRSPIGPVLSKNNLLSASSNGAPIPTQRPASALSANVKPLPRPQSPFMQMPQIRPVSALNVPQSKPLVGPTAGAVRLDRKYAFDPTGRNVQVTPASGSKPTAYQVAC